MPADTSTPRDDEPVGDEREAAARGYAAAFVAAHVAFSHPSVDAVLDGDELRPPTEQEDLMAMAVLDGARHPNDHVRRSALVTTLTEELLRIDPPVGAVDLDHGRRLLEAAVENLHDDLLSVPTSGAWHPGMRAEFLRTRFINGLQQGEAVLGDPDQPRRLAAAVPTSALAASAAGDMVNEVIVLVQAVIGSVERAERARGAIVLDSLGPWAILQQPGSTSSRSARRRRAVAPTSHDEALASARSSVARLQSFPDFDARLAKLAEQRLTPADTYALEVVRRSLDAVKAFQVTSGKDGRGGQLPLTACLTGLRSTEAELHEAWWVAQSPRLVGPEQLERVTDAVAMRSAYRAFDEVTAGRSRAASRRPTGSARRGRGGGRGLG